MGLDLEQLAGVERDGVDADELLEYEEAEGDEQPLPGRRGGEGTTARHRRVLLQTFERLVTSTLTGHCSGGLGNVRVRWSLMELV